MKLLEYKGKELFAKYGIKVPKGKIVSNAEDFYGLNFPLILKAQVPTGGRGKAGGIRKVKDIDEGKKELERIKNMTIGGFKVSKVLAEEAIDIEKELYLSILLDRSKRMPLIMVSSEGGVDIESVADEKIIKEWINPLIGLQNFNVRNILSNLEINEKEEISRLIFKLYDLFCRYDCELVEINPLAITGSKEVVAVDSKVIINDDALYRHPDIVADDVELMPLEREAKEKGITFIQLDGNIGVIANGAGLTMATLDAITYFNGKAGVFLDLGGTDDPEKVKQAFELMKKAKPKVILLNLFGGITKCDTVASGVRAVISEKGVDCPIVARIKGVREKEAREILKDAGLITANTLQEAAKIAVEIAGG